MSAVILICNRDLVSIGQPVTSWTAIDLTVKFNEVGVGSFDAPANDDLIRAIRTPDSRVVVLDRSEVLFSGPIETYELAWQRDGRGTVKVNFSDHLALVAERLAYPNPALPPNLQDVVAWHATGPADTLMLSAVNLNAGPGALVARRVPQLTVATAAGVGGSIDLLAKRMEPLTELLRRAAIAGGNLGFRVDQVGRQLVFSVYIPRDRSKHVRYAQKLGSVRSMTVRHETPEATVALVAGSGEGISRPMREVVDPDTIATGWRRSEIWVSQDDELTDPALDQAGADALAEKVEKVGITLDVDDQPGRTYGVDYRVGDYVGVLCYGAAVKELVTQAHIVITPKEGRVVTPTIGTGQTTADSGLANALRRVDRRVGSIERR